MIDQQRRVEVAEPTGAPVVRNGRRARWLHTLVYLSTVFLAYSGIAVLLEGHPGLSRPLGGHAPTATSHRLVGYGSCRRSSDGACGSTSSPPGS